MKDYIYTLIFDSMLKNRKWSELIRWSWFAGCGYGSLVGSHRRNAKDGRPRWERKVVTTSLLIHIPAKLRRLLLRRSGETVWERRWRTWITSTKRETKRGIVWRKDTTTGEGVKMSQNWFGVTKIYEHWREVEKVWISNTERLTTLERMATRRYENGNL